MRTMSQHSSFQLDEEGIDLFSEWLDERLKDLDTERADRVRARLLYEDVLLSLYRHFGNSHAVEVHIEKGLLSRLRIQIMIEGERFNPLGSIGEEDENWGWSAVPVVGLHLQYSYSMGFNVLTLSVPFEPLNPVLKLCIAVVFGVGMGLLGNAFIPVSLQNNITDVVVNPLIDVWLRVLGAISSPIILITAAVTTLNTKRIDEAGGSRFRLLIRYFFLTSIIVAGAVVFCQVLVPLDLVSSKLTVALVQSILDDALEFIPKNLVDPFASTNTPQLLLVGFALGNVLIRLGDQAKALRLLVRQIDAAGLVIAETTSLLVPLFLGLFLCLIIWQHHYRLLLSIWKPMALATYISLLCIAVAVMIVALIVKVNPLLLVRKLWRPFVTVLRRGSLVATIEELSSTCHDRFGINKRYAGAAAPQALNLFMPISAVGIYVFLVFVAQQQHLRVDWVWIARGAVMSVVLFVATPPVAGANLLAYVVFFTDLRIAGSSLMEAMIFDVIFGVFAGAANLVMLLLEIIVQAHYTGFLDDKILRDEQ